MNDVIISPELFWDTFINMPWYYFLLPVAVVSGIMLKTIFGTVKRNKELVKLV